VVKVKCGEGYEKWPSGYCCSVYGWYGQSERYCALSMDCQNTFSRCK